jgi:hypothetical protein
MERVMEGTMKPESKDDWALILDLVHIIRTSSKEVLVELRKAGEKIIKQQEKIAYEKHEDQRNKDKRRRNDGKGDISDSHLPPVVG